MLLKFELSKTDTKDAVDVVLSKDNHYIGDNQLHCKPAVPVDNYQQVEEQKNLKLWSNKNNEVCHNDVCRNEGQTEEIEGLSNETVPGLLSREIRALTIVNDIKPTNLKKAEKGITHASTKLTTAATPEKHIKKDSPKEPIQSLNKESNPVLRHMTVYDVSKFIENFGESFKIYKEWPIRNAVDGKELLYYALMDLKEGIKEMISSDTTLQIHAQHARVILRKTKSMATKEDIAAAQDTL